MYYLKQCLLEKEGPILRGRSSGYVGHQSAPHAGAPALNTKDLPSGIYSAVNKAVVNITNIRESSIAKHTCSMTVEHGHLNASLATMGSKVAIYWSRRLQLTIIC